MPPASPSHEYKRKHGDRVGHNWRIPNVQGKRAVRHVVFDTNYWKSFCHARLVVPMGDRGCLSLFGDNPDLHRLFAEHITAEYRVKTEGRGRTVDEWKLRVAAVDNHWLDCLVGCAVGASIMGAILPGTTSDPQPSDHASSFQNCNGVDDLWITNQRIPRTKNSVACNVVIAAASICRSFTQDVVAGAGLLRVGNAVTAANE